MPKMGDLWAVVRIPWDCVFMRSCSFLTELFLQGEFCARPGFLKGINGERFFAGRKSVGVRKSRLRECCVRVRIERESSRGKRLELERLVRGCSCGSTPWMTPVCNSETESLWFLVSLGRLIQMD